MRIHLHQAAYLRPQNSITSIVYFLTIPNMKYHNSYGDEIRRENSKDDKSIEIFATTDLVVDIPLFPPDLRPECLPKADERPWESFGEIQGLARGEWGGECV